MDGWNSTPAAWFRVKRRALRKALQTAAFCYDRPRSAETVVLRLQNDGLLVLLRKEFGGFYAVHVPVLMSSGSYTWSVAHRQILGLVEEMQAQVEMSVYVFDSDRDDVQLGCWLLLGNSVQDRSIAEPPILGGEDEVVVLSPQVLDEIERVHPRGEGWVAVAGGGLAVVEGDWVTHSKQEDLSGAAGPVLLPSEWLERLRPLRKTYRGSCAVQASEKAVCGKLLDPQTGVSVVIWADAQKTARSQIEGLLPSGADLEVEVDGLVMFPFDRKGG